jgi:hypothetical protein
VSTNGHRTTQTRCSPEWLLGFDVPLCEARKVRTQLEVTLKGPAGAMDARLALLRLEEVLDLLAELEDAERLQRPGKRRPPRRSGPLLILRWVV